jgi:hypothetical protein
MPMRSARFHVFDLILAVMFVGVFGGLALRTWGDFFFMHGLVMAGVLLFAIYLVLIIMFRQHHRRPND